VENRHPLQVDPDEFAAALADAMTTGGADEYEAHEAAVLGAHEADEYNDHLHEPSWTVQRVDEDADGS
jgi:hypothetical protein